VPPREWRLRIEDMLEALEDIRRYASGKSAEDFRSDRKTIQAVLYNLAVLGEAARFVPDDVIARHADIDWSKMRGLRNVLVHEYFGADVTIVWQTIESDLPPLADKLRQVLQDA
jgi:uncharacterized protein with HEPN domain